MPDAVMTDYIDAAAVDALVNARHGDPFAILGPHGDVVRAFVPHADSVAVVDRATGATLGALQRLHPAGLWSGQVGSPSPYRLRIGQGGSFYDIEDTYSFPPLLGDIDIYLLGEGRHRDFGRALGAHPVTMDAVPGVRFAVWAPNAQPRLRRGRLQRLGRALPPDAAAAGLRRMGAVRASRGAGRALQV